jgi:hypothetical protein
MRRRPTTNVRCREQQNEDDERLEKEVNEVVAGKRRTRRRRGGAGGLLGSDVSDDESSDDEARALRQRLAKKRRVEGDTLDALARDPKTVAFHATYHMGLVDDADDFAHLDRDDGEDGDNDGSGVRENREHGAREEVRMGEGENEDEVRGGDVDEDEDEDIEMAAPSNTDKEEVSITDLRKELQDFARSKRVRSPCAAFFLLLTSTNLRSGIPNARPRGRVLGGPRPRRARRRCCVTADARAHGVLCSRQSATTCTAHTHGRRSRRALSRTSSAQLTHPLLIILYLAPHPCRRAERRVVRATHEAMGEGRRREQSPQQPSRRRRWGRSGSHWPPSARRNRC